MNCGCNNSCEAPKKNPCPSAEVVIEAVEDSPCLLSVSYKGFISTVDLSQSIHSCESQTILRLNTTTDEPRLEYLDERYISSDGETFLQTIPIKEIAEQITIFDLGGVEVNEVNELKTVIGYDTADNFATLADPSLSGAKRYYLTHSTNSSSWRSIDDGTPVQPIGIDADGAIYAYPGGSGTVAPSGTSSFTGTVEDGDTNKLIGTKVVTNNTDRPMVYNVQGKFTSVTPTVVAPAGYTSVDVGVWVASTAFYYTPSLDHNPEGYSTGLGGAELSINVPYNVTTAPIAPGDSFTITARASRANGSATLADDTNVTITIYAIGMAVG